MNPIEKKTPHTAAHRRKMRTNIRVEWLLSSRSLTSVATMSLPNYDISRKISTVTTPVATPVTTPALWAARPYS
jgi:hypothetical protein